MPHRGAVGAVTARMRTFALVVALLATAIGYGVSRETGDAKAGLLAGLILTGYAAFLALLVWAGQRPTSPSLRREHYITAERLLAEADVDLSLGNFEEAERVVATARVHAALAVAEALERGDR